MLGAIALMFLFRAMMIIKDVLLTATARSSSMIVTLTRRMTSRSAIPPSCSASVLIGRVSQAAARAHRMGQTRPVRVLRLISRDTVDEAILKRATAKRALTLQVLRNADPGTAQLIDDIASSQVTSEELRKMLRAGLASLMLPDEDVMSDAQLESLIGPTDDQGCWVIRPEPSVDSQVLAERSSSTSTPASEGPKRASVAATRSRVSETDIDAYVTHLVASASDGADAVRFWPASYTFM
jgi:hypothetical protein